MSSDGFTFLPLGAIIQTFTVGGHNIVQGFPTQAQYVSHNAPFFGETIGRVCNRISGAQLDNVAGKSHALVANNAPNSLHGGDVGWGKRIWEGPTPVGLRSIPGVDNLDGGESVQFTLTSEDGDQGFPGTVEAKITYTSGKEGGKIVLGMEYEARLVDGEETPVSMTNHSYFNISDGPTIAGTTMKLPTSQHLPVDGGAIPTGDPVAWPSSLTEPFTMSATAPNIDHCFTLTDTPGSVPIDTREEPLVCNVDAHHAGTGLHLQVYSTEPSFQIYTGHGIDVPAVEGAAARGSRSAFCCEPSRWVNAVNVEGWKGMVMLKRGETYGCRIVYKAWKD